MRGILPAAPQYSPLSQRDRYMLLDHWESRWLRWCRRAAKESRGGVFEEKGRRCRVFVRVYLGIGAVVSANGGKGLTAQTSSASCECTRAV